MITLIPKQGKDISLLQNYRPITLLNTDYKIGAKSIASRVKRILLQVIGVQQTGFLKGRFIGENIRYVLDLTEYSHRYQIPGFVLFVDFEKAFDKLEWCFIYRTLTFLTLVQVLRTGFKLYMKELQPVSVITVFLLGSSP